MGIQGWWDLLQTAFLHNGILKIIYLQNIMTSIEK